MKLVLNKIMIFAKDMKKMSAFYQRYFDFKIESDDGKIIELQSRQGGSHILIHRAGNAIKIEQVCIKLVFEVTDVEKFRAKCIKNGLKFGALHSAEGYFFSDTKDPGNNKVQISSRVARTIKN